MTLSQECNHAKFGTFSSNGMAINSGPSAVMETNYESENYFKSDILAKKQLIYKYIAATEIFQQHYP